MNDNRFDNLTFLFLLNSIEGIGPLKILSLYSKLQSFENIFNANIRTLVKIEGINNTLASKIIAQKKNKELFREKLEAQLERLSRVNGNIMTFWDTDYPFLLKNIYYPPIILYTIGKFNEKDKFSIAIVGTRNPTLYGKLTAEKFSTELVDKSITIVSGLARGIDSVAHSTAIKTGGRTIAVIGSGLDVIYPPENKKLFGEICETGMIISEYELGAKPDAQNFPKRNRIISGLSLGSLIIETKLNGGAMQTAAYAIDQNREVFAVPGNINTPQAEGPNTLIQRNEAKLVTSADDILNELRIFEDKSTNVVIKKSKAENLDLNLFENKLLTFLNSEPIHIDDLAIKVSMSTSDCLVNLLTLEFKGLVKQLPGKMFISI